MADAEQPEFIFLPFGTFFVSPRFELADGRSFLRENPMRWTVIGSGSASVALLALGFNLILPLSDVLDNMCVLVGAVSTVIFWALVDGA